MKTSKTMGRFGLAVAALMLAGMAVPAEAASDRYCRGYAHNYASQYSAGPGPLLGGAVTGGLVGGLIGSFSGAFGAGAAIGAGVGALAGVAHAPYRYDRLYWHAYNWCRAN